ncbi:hypothetical protein CR152_25785 [Massilia violaceinigra]|uniref:Uncharacterized protein n=1 Tax=Massilia violaceinigra TaxID=2045208 RepID=A0A2D2DRC0_9BURK|nr:hypothetical protein CR152_25785 [Massilia violaceinigra]
MPLFMQNSGYTAFGLETAASIFQSIAASGYTAQALMSYGNSGAIAAAAGASAGAASATAGSFHGLSQAASTWSQIQQMRTAGSESG